MSEPAKLRVILDDHDIRKLVLPSGIPGTREDLELIIRETFQLQGNFSLLYKDAEFGDFFSLTTTADLKDKDTVKVVLVEPLYITLTETHPAGPVSTLSDRSSSSSSHTSSAETIILSSAENRGRSQQWPSPFEIPEFAYDTELILESANAAFRKDGTCLNNPSIKSDVLEKLAERIYQFCAYPTSEQICNVAEALIQKHPCLKEPGSFSGLYGWQTRLKYKMGNYRSKLRRLGCPELVVNSASNKTAAATGVKKPRKAEVNFLPPYPTGESKQSLEKDRVDLLSEVKKKDNQKTISEKMSKTFSYRRQEVVNENPAIEDLLHRWPALFEAIQIKEEFKRITTIELEATFAANLDKHTVRLLTLFRAKGGAAGRKMCPLLDVFTQDETTEMRRDVVIRCLIVYFSEKVDDLIKDYHGASPDEVQEDLKQHTMKIVTKGGSTEDDPLDVGIVLEGREVLAGLSSVARACALLLGLIYAVNLSYPKQLRYTFECCQKMLLELDSGKLSPKVHTLKSKLLC
ncbi:sterile alpha motif domain-containing protein 3-like [Brachyhypopomus gauderio]|uniref:sterile alpha motif domain-containing protein 3-like n=1 Tax=Brachyhypopomus gauderio TaxID=698409 RepID=UPI0040411DB3